MTLHNPHTVATPSQRLAAAAHNARMERMGNARAAPPVIVSVEPAAPPKPKSKDWFYIVESERKTPPVRQIQAMVAERYGVTLADILSQRRTKRVVMPRQIAVYLTKEMTSLSYPAIGRHFGGRDHTTCLHAHNKISRMIEAENDFALEVSNIREWLTS